MNKMLEATYEGEGLLRLRQELKGVKPNANVQVIVLSRPVDEAFVVEDVGPAGLQQRLIEFEARYSMTSKAFYERFRKGEMGDRSDFIVWAGLYEISLEMSDSENGR